MLKTREDYLSHGFLYRAVLVHVRPVVSRVQHHSFVVRVLIDVAFDEWRVAFSQNVKNNSEGENVGSLCVIRRVAEYLRTHVPLCSEDGFASLAIFDNRGKPKIGEFQLKVLVQQNVLGFYVSVDNVVAVEILEHYQELSDVILKSLPLESPGFENYVENLPISGQL